MTPTDPRPGARGYSLSGVPPGVVRLSRDDLSEDVDGKLVFAVPPRHERVLFFRLIKGSKRPGYNSMDTLTLRLFTDVGVKGKSVAQLCYNNRRDLLPVRTLEAGRCVGFDVSEEFIKQARLLTRTNNQECEFVCVDAHEIPASYDGCFDIVFFTSGSLRWMADPELRSIDCAVGE